MGPLDELLEAEAKRRIAELRAQGKIVKTGDVVNGGNRQRSS